MNQPKFKFGDIVKSKKGDPFVVSSISFNGFLYTYNRRGGDYATDEEYLKLYSEPKEKKLFAYSVEGDFGQIVFATNENSKHVNCNLSRAPEYDFEYPSEEVK